MTKQGATQSTPGPSQATIPEDDINHEAIEPDNQVFAVATPSQNGTRNKSMWSGPMEIMMLDLYVEEVNKGRKSDSSFQTASHHHVAQELRKFFPEVKHVLDANKVELKLS